MVRIGRHQRLDHGLGIGADTGLLDAEYAGGERQAVPAPGQFGAAVLHGQHG